MIETALPVADGRAAQHCAELLSRAAEPVNPAQEVARLAQRFAQNASRLLGEMWDVRGLKIEAAGSSLVAADAAVSAIGVHTVNSFFAFGTERLGALLSVSTCEVNAQFERMLGGDGRVDRTSVRLPRSAHPFVARFEQGILGALREAAAREEFSLASSMGVAAEIAPFARDEEVWVLQFTVSPPLGTEWTMTLAVCRHTLSQLLNARVASPATGRAIGERGLDQSAIGLIELPTSAILVDVNIALSRLTQLQPGSVIPIAINRSIPLLIDHAVVAHGTAGEVDDRIALEITHTSIPGHN